MFLSEIHPKVRKELHKREYILRRTPEETDKIRQNQTLDPKKENRDLLAESFAKSHWIRVFSPVDTKKLVSNPWKQKLQQKRMQKPEFGVSNRYFAPTGDADLIEEWKDFQDDAGGGTPMMIDNPLGGYNTVLLQSGLMYRKEFKDAEILNATTWENQNKMYTGFMGVYGRNQKSADLMAPITDKESVQGPNTSHGGMPIPGIKNISVDYAGEMKASKEATIEWVCWSFRDLERLTPHFLEMGKLVVLEWGWGGIGGTDKPIPIDYDKILEATEGRTTKVSLHDEVQETVFENGGNYDAMVGVISNFEWSLRSDGGFDCTTKLKSRGVNIINQVMGSPTNSSGLGSNMGKEDEEEGTYSQVTFDKFMDQIDTFINDIGKTMVISSDALKTYLKNQINNGGKGTGSIGETGANKVGFMNQKLKPFLEWQFNNEKVYKSGDEFKEGNVTDGVFQPVAWDLGPNIDDKVGPWLSWGWIEDNILTRFLGKVDSNNKLVQEFRSVDLIYKGEKELGYEPTKISNHKSLITVDPEICIIPGQYPLHLDDWQGEIIEDNPWGYTAAITDGMIGTMFNIPPFRAYKWKEDNGEYKHPSRNANPGEYHQHLLDESYKPIHEAGYMRHLLIHIDAFKEAFEGVDSVEAACQTLFNKLNSTTGIWDLHLRTDGERVKVVDRNYTVEKVKDLVHDESIWEHGVGGFKDKNKLPKGKVFIFPSWGRNSMVNSQTLSAKMPEGAAVTAMYGGVASPGANAPEGGGDPADFLASSALQSTVDPTQKNITGAWEKKNGKLGKFGTQFPYNLKLAKDGKWEKFGVGNGFLFDVSLVAGAKPTGTGKQTSVDLPVDTNTFIREALVTNLQLVTNNTHELTYNKDLSDNLFINIDQYNSRLVNYNKGWTDANDQAYNPYVAESQRVVPEKSDVGGNADMQIETTAMIDNLYDKKTGKLRNTFPHAYVDAMKYLIGVNRATSIFGIGGSSPMLKMELELEIQGIGGIVPGNAFNVSMLPSNYEGKVVFQIVDINQELSDTGWKTTLTGQMRVNISEHSPEQISSFIQRRAAAGNQEEIDTIVKDVEKLFPTTPEGKKKVLELFDSGKAEAMKHAT